MNKTVALLVAVCLAGCAEPTDTELLTGKWELERATESVTVGSAPTVTTELTGYAGQTMELADDGICRRTDRGESRYSLWFVSDERHLIFTEMDHSEVIEDYSINDLTNERLVCSDAYSSSDSQSGERTLYAYSFEYRKCD